MDDDETRHECLRCTACGPCGGAWSCGPRTPNLRSRARARRSVARALTRSPPPPAASPGFCSPTGQLRDPSNTQADLRATLDRAGYPWVTSHTFRKTVASRLDDAGSSIRHIADQLGHARPSTTLDHYLGRRAITTADHAAALASLARRE